MSRRDQYYSQFIAPSRKTGQDVVQSDFQAIIGRVIVVGDIHGADAFDNLKNSLGSNDRVVCVGDLVDRGSKSFEILETIRKDSRFCVVRGNHEEMFLQYMDARREIEKNINDQEKKEIKKFQTRLKKLSKKNKLQLELVALRNFLLYQKLCSLDQANDYFIFLQNGGFWANDKTLAELAPIETYIDDLPYIRNVIPPHGDPFLVCHADMSWLSNDDVENFITRNKSLTDKDKARLTWARNEERAGDISYQDYQLEIKRTHTSTRVYVGHEMVIRENISVVRKETNHINLDFGAFFKMPLVGVEYPNKAVVFGDIQNDRFQKKFFEQLVELHKKMGAIEFSSIKTFENYKLYLLNASDVDVESIKYERLLSQCTVKTLHSV